MTVDFSLYGNNPFASGLMSMGSNPFAMLDMNSIMSAISNAQYTTMMDLSLMQMPVMQMPTLQMPSFNFSAFSASRTSSASSTQNGTCRPNVKLDQAFLNKVKQIAQRINCDYKDLLALMNSESGLNSKAVNSNGGATGLIQFMPSTARSMGTSTQALKNMTPIQQLDYVERCITSAKRSAGIPATQRLSAGQLYALIFLPARANRQVLTSAGEKYYAANKGLDLNRDGNISISDLDNRIRSKRVDERIFTA